MFNTTRFYVESSRTARRIATTTTLARLVKQAEAAGLLLFGFRLGSLGLGGGGSSLAGGSGGSSGGGGGSGGRTSAGADAGKETLDVNACGGLGEEAGPEGLDVSDTGGVDDLLDGISGDGDTLQAALGCSVGMVRRVHCLWWVEELGEGTRGTGAGVWKEHSIWRRNNWRTMRLEHIRNREIKSGRNARGRERECHAHQQKQVQLPTARANGEQRERGEEGIGICCRTSSWRMSVA